MTGVAWLNSIVFEFVEMSFEHWMPNFAECWWDHWVMDVLTSLCVVVCVSVLQCVDDYCLVYLCCSVLQCVAVCCSVLQGVAVC